MAFQDFSKILVKYFNDNIILPSFMLPFSILLAISVLSLNEALLLSSAGESAMSPLSQHSTAQSFGKSFIWPIICHHTHNTAQSFGQFG